MFSSSCKILAPLSQHEVTCAGTEIQQEQAVLTIIIEFVPECCPIKTSRNLEKAKRRVVALRKEYDV